jgi:hypothetical protein
MHCEENNYKNVFIVSFLLLTRIHRNVKVANGRLMLKSGRRVIVKWPFKPWPVVHFGGTSLTGEFLIFFGAFSLLSLLSHLQFASLCRKSIRIKRSRSMVKALTRRTSPSIARLSMPPKVKKHKNSEMQSFFTFWMRDMEPYSNCFLCLSVWFVRWNGWLEGGNVVEGKFIPVFFWSYAPCLSDTLGLWQSGRIAYSDARWASGGKN